LKSGETQSPEEPPVLLQDGREGFKLPLLKHCLTQTSYILGRASRDEMDATTQLNESCFHYYAFCATPSHLCMLSLVWVSGSGSCSDLDCGLTNCRAHEQVRH